MQAMVTPLVGSARAPAAFCLDVEDGAATFVRPGSPLNKFIGVGLDAPVPDAALAALEQRLDTLGEPTRVELSTLAAIETCAQLSARGYQLAGFENVLAAPLVMETTRQTSAIAVELAEGDLLPAFRDTLVDGTIHADDTGVVVDHFSRETIEMVLDDFMCASAFRRYVAFHDGAMAGAASMHVHGSVAMLTGSATRPAHRRRGVQAALLARRLADARALGADIAIVTTAPGTQSQANVMKAGFSLAYARAILVRPVPVGSPTSGAIDPRL